MNLRTTVIAGALSACVLMISPAVASAASNSLVVIHGSSVFVRGASVTSNANGILSATSVFGPSTFSWSVGTNASTTIFSKNGSMSLTQVGIGDVINFFGMFSGNGLTVTANAIEDTRTSSVPERDSFSGKVTATSTTGFTIKRNNGTSQIVTVNSATVFKTNNGSSTTAAALSLGTRVKVKGSWNADNTVFTARSVRVYLGKVILWERNEERADIEDRAIGDKINKAIKKFLRTADVDLDGSLDLKVQHRDDS